MHQLRRLAVATAASALLLIAAAPATAADVPPANSNANCLGQFVVFLAFTSDPNLGQGVVAPGATTAPGAVAEQVVPAAKEKPHTYHC